MLPELARYTILALREVFFTPRIFVRFLIIFICAALLLVYMSNLILIHTLFQSDTIMLTQQVWLIWQLLIGLFIERGAVAGVVIFSLMLLFCSEIALMGEYVRHFRTLIRGSVTRLNITSFVGGVVGLGCIACGSLLSIVPVAVSFSTAILVLPFDGLEFILIGVVALLVSNGLLMKRINQLEQLAQYSVV